MFYEITIKIPVTDRGEGFGGLQEWDQGLKQYKSVVDSWSWGGRAWQRECS